MVGVDGEVDLRERLVAAKLAGHKNDREGYPYCFRSNESAAEVAVAIVVEWLRESLDQHLAIARLADTLNLKETEPVSDVRDLILDLMDLIARAKDMPAAWTWDTARPAHKNAYRRLTRRMLVAVLAEVRTAVGAR
jgi:hypothetical protein